ncbi:MAG: LysM peptidoglycan-binding domain-containing protein [Oscillospiraceae bacterium]
MNLKEWIIVAAAVLLLVVLVISFFAALSPTLDRVEWERRSYTVQKGDTLWGIAQRYCPDNVDLREWISKVKSINGLSDSMIRTGQRITILVPMRAGQ